MKSLTCLSIIFLLTINLLAQDYLIRFESSDSSMIPDSVFVINTVSGENIALSGSDVLHLKNSSIPTNLPSGYQNESLTLFPNPTEDYSTLEFETTRPGTADLAIYNVTGTKLAQLQRPVPAGRHTFQASGLGTGLYMIRINAGGMTFTGKLVSNSNRDPNARLSYMNSVENKESGETLKSTDSPWYMEYKPGEKLLVTFTSGVYTTTVSAVPTRDETIIVYFYDCIDRDNNVYPTVEIGSQVWMGANLKTTRFNNGVIIPEKTRSVDWIAEDSAAYSWQRNDMETYRNAYGALYNGYAVANENLCPLDWHVPSAAEFKMLEQTVGGRAVAGGRLKESGLLHWEDPNAGATNSSRFTMLPGGYRSGEDGSGFWDLGRYGYLWSATLWANEATGNYWVFSKDEEKTEQGVSGLHTGFSVRCIMNDSVSATKIPRLSTDSVSQVGLGSAMVHYTITFDGGRDITSTGVCWGITEDPDSWQCKTTAVTGIGHYVVELDSLKQNTVYYARAFAINAKGIGYGNTLTFKTNENTRGTVTDVEGNQYRTVKIGRQVWMAENLRTATFNDTRPIVLQTYYHVWTRMTTAAYCWYENNESFKIPYGALYNWYAADSKKLCPSGWHVPRIKEWQELSDYLGGDSVSGGKMKEAGSSHWNAQAEGVTNSSEFTAVPGGWRNATYEEIYAHQYGGAGMHEKAAWLSATTDEDGYPLSPALEAGSNELTIRHTQRQEGNSVRCLKNDSIIQILPPTVKTDTAILIPRKWASVKGSIISNGGSSLTMQGVCWSTHPDPDTSDFIMTDTNRLNKFSIEVRAWELNTTYYIRAFGANEGGVGYGSTFILTTLAPVVYGNVSDVEGNNYKTVEIGTQTWMAENLKTTTFNDGTPIPLVTDYPVWKTLSTPAYCWYENNIGFKTPYGAIYNWYTCLGSKLCPTGWHVPNLHDWETLMDYLGGEEVAGGKLKEAGTSNWTAESDAVTNSTGFTALPGGIRGDSYEGYFNNGFYRMHEYGTWLSSSTDSYDAHYIRNAAMLGESNSVIMGYEHQHEGSSVRCVQNITPTGQ